MCGFTNCNNCREKKIRAIRVEGGTKREEKVNIKPFHPNSLTSYQIVCHIKGIDGLE